MPIFSKDGQRVASARPTRENPIQARQRRIDQEGTSARPLERDPIQTRESAILTGRDASSSVNDFLIVDGEGVLFSANQLQFDTNLGFEVIEDADNAGRVIVRIPIPSIPFSATSSLNTQSSSVFSALSGSVILTISTVGTFTSITGSSPASGTVSGMTVTWMDSSPYVAAGTYSFSANVSGLNSVGDPGTATTAGSFQRFVPEFVNETQPALFSEFSNERASTSSITGIGGMATFLSTTTDYGPVGEVTVAGFPVSAPRVDTIDSTADQAGTTYTYNVYRIPIDAGVSTSIS